jgi:DNA-directed RNA polymerase specialized sigma24 family protein
MLLRLVHFEGQTIAHAAELMDTTVDAARSRYGRALVRLQKLMRKNAPGAEA